MKKIVLYKKITDYIIDNKPQFLFSVLVFVLGVVIGSLSATSVHSTDSGFLGEYINNFVSAFTIQYVSHSELFKFTLYSNLKILLFIGVSGIWVYFIPFGFLQLFSKGYKLSFSIVFITQLYGYKGILFTFVALIPQILILIPTMLFYMVFTMNFSLLLRKRRKENKCILNKELITPNVLVFLFVCFLMVIEILVEVFIIPPILKPICTFMNY